jgi:hypothetical protein
MTIDERARAVVKAADDDVGICTCPDCIKAMEPWIQCVAAALRAVVEECAGIAERRVRLWGKHEHLLDSAMVEIRKTEASDIAEKIRATLTGETS